MGKLIAIEFGMTWAIPVDVCIRHGIWQRIPGPDAALICMRDLWPPLRVAGAACLGLCRTTDPVAARDKFVAASIEAGILGYPHLGGSNGQQRPIVSGSWISTVPALHLPIRVSDF